METGIITRQRVHVKNDDKLSDLVCCSMVRETVSKQNAARPYIHEMLRLHAIHRCVALRRWCKATTMVKCFAYHNNFRMISARLLCDLFHIRLRSIHACKLQGWQRIKARILVYCLSKVIRQ